MTLRATIARSLSKGLIVLCLVSTGVSLMEMQSEVRSDAAMEQYNAPSWPEQLAEKHGCWTGEAPEGAVPTHAILRKPGEVAASYSADVDYALDAAFEDRYPDAQVHAFCV